MDKGAAASVAAALIKSCVRSFRSFRAGTGFCFLSILRTGSNLHCPAHAFDQLFAGNSPAKFIQTTCCPKVIIKHNDIAPRLIVSKGTGTCIR